MDSVLSFLEVKCYLKMNALRDGWFSEIQEEMWPGQAMSLQVEEVLFHEKSKFQDVQVLKT